MSILELDRIDHPKVLSGEWATEYDDLRGQWLAVNTQTQEIRTAANSIAQYLTKSWEPKAHNTMSTVGETETHLFSFYGADPTYSLYIEKGDIEYLRLLQPTVGLMWRKHGRRLHGFMAYLSGAEIEPYIPERELKKPVGEIGLNPNQVPLYVRGLEFRPFMYYYKDGQVAFVDPKRVIAKLTLVSALAENDREYSERAESRPLEIAQERQAILDAVRRHSENERNFDSTQLRARILHDHLTTLLPNRE